MAAQVLYLKWRPLNFEDVVGQEHVTQTLKNALRAGRIAHAYLFAGPRGTGKTTMARLLAKAVNCLDEDVTNRPCNKCMICQSINEGRLLDLIEMDAASHTGVDNVREAIRDKVGFRPNQARYKVYVIDEVHMLSTSAFNALLKTLEEPPEHVIFCLATTEPHRILPTILSRCQRFDFRRIPLAALMARLRYIADQEGIQIEEGALRFIARTSTGSARDAISLLDQLTAYGDEVITVERVRSVLGLSDAQMVHALVTHLAAHDIGRGLDVINQVVEKGVDVRQFTRQVVNYVRSLLLLRVGGDTVSLGLDVQAQADLRILADRLSPRDLLQAIKLFNQAQLDLRGSDQNQLALELAFVEAAMVEPAVERARQPQERLREEEKPALEEALLPVSVQPALQRTERPTSAPVRRGAGAPTPPAAPPKSESVLRGAEAVTREEPSQLDQRPSSLSAEDIKRKQDEISQALRAEGPLGKGADGLFRSVFVIGQVSVQDGNRVLLSLPPNVLRKVTAEVTQVVEQVVCAVLGRRCQVQFVERGARVSQHGAPPRKGSESSTSGTSVRPGSEHVQGASAEMNEPQPASDPYQDPVVRYLIDRGGRITDVHELPEE